MKDSKFTIVIDILGVIAFWMIAIGTMWSVYYTRLVYLQNEQVMVSQSTTVVPPNVDNPSTPPDSTGPNDYYIVPIPPSDGGPDNGPSITIPSDPNNSPDFQENDHLQQVPLSF